MKKYLIGALTALALCGALSAQTIIPAGPFAGLGAAIIAFLQNPSSANLATAIGDGTGSGANVFANSPSISNPTITTALNAAGLVKASDQQTATTTVGSLVRLRYQALGVNFNAANSDTAFTLNLPSGITRYFVNIIRITHASGTLTTATFGVFTAVGGGGTTILTGQAITVSTGAENTANNGQTVNPATVNTQTYNAAQLFFRVQTAQGVAATADVNIEIILIP